ncbi:MAG: hypothetical protein AAFN93_04105 [Bacteroidota bacterium]
MSCELRTSMDWKPLKIKYFKDDAEGFKEIIDHLIFKLVEFHNPDEVAVIRIKNWFDHKWLNYSGQGPQKYDTHSKPGIPFVLKPFWTEEITVPPFNPNRVLSTTFYKPDEHYNDTFIEPIHIYQNSTENLKNRITKRSDNGICFWVSTNSTTNRQGSLMTYIIKGEQIETWYASIEEHGLWKINRTKGISKNKLLLLTTELNEKFKNN